MKTTFVILTSLLFVFSASQLSQAAGPSPGPPFKQCSPSGYNCNFLILVDKYGTVTVNRDPNLYSYPPLNTDTGQLIGVQNNSSSTIHSISLIKTTDHPNLEHFCAGPNQILPPAPNINIVNIVANISWTYLHPFYSIALPFPYGPEPPFSTLDWGTSCDLVFPAGLPKGGTSYFSLGGPASWPYFRGFLKSVVAYIKFPTEIQEGDTVSGDLKIWPSNNMTPVTLSLAVTSGTGSAVFASPITFTQSGSFQITGVQRSSTPTNIQLTATANAQEVSKTYFTVLPIPEFSVAYSSYIPVDSILSVTECTYNQVVTVPHIYMGDANRGTYRATESIKIVPDEQESSTFFAATGETRNYGFGSPANHSTLSSADEDGVWGDCYLWNNAGQASAGGFTHDESYPFPQQGQVHFAGSASNPLEVNSPINWDMRTIIDTTVPSAPTAKVNYNHTCYPSHQIKVNGQVVYLYTPPRNDQVYVTGCLLLQSGKVVGEQPSPIQVPAIPAE